MRRGQCDGVAAHASDPLVASTYRAKDVGRAVTACLDGRPLLDDRRYCRANVRRNLYLIAINEDKFVDVTMIVWV